MFVWLLLRFIRGVCAVSSVLCLGLIRENRFVFFFIVVRDLILQIFRGSGVEIGVKKEKLYILISIEKINFSGHEKF